MGRDVTSRDGSQSGSGDMIVGFRSGNGIMRVSPDRNGLLNVWTSGRDDESNLIGNGSDVVDIISTCGSSEEKKRKEFFADYIPC